MSTYELAVVCEHNEEPLQPIGYDAQGVIRFRENAMVRQLLDFTTARGFDLNEIAMRHYTQQDRIQLAQLIGYSVCGFGELSYVDSYSCQRADELDVALMDMYSPDSGMTVSEYDEEPLQPIGYDRDLVIAFRENTIVRDLVICANFNGLDDHEIRSGWYTNTDRIQFEQLLGIGVAEFIALPSVSRAMVQRVLALSETLVREYPHPTLTVDRIYIL